MLKARLSFARRMVHFVDPAKITKEGHFAGRSRKPNGYVRRVKMPVHESLLQILYLFASQQ